jgi:WD40 repeat protein
MRFVAGLILLLINLAAVPVTAQEMPSLFDPITTENAHRLQAITTLGFGWLHNVYWTADGNYLLAAGSNGLVIYDRTSWNVAATIAAENPALADIALSPDGSRVALVEQGSIRVFEVGTQEMLYQVEAQVYGSPTRDRPYVRMSESYLGALHRNSDDLSMSFRLWDAHTGQLLAELENVQEWSDPANWYFDDALAEEALAENDFDVISRGIGRYGHIMLEGDEASATRIVVSDDGRFILYLLCPNPEDPSDICEANQIVLQDAVSREIVHRITVSATHIGFADTDAGQIVTAGCVERSTTYYIRCQRWAVQLIDLGSGAQSTALPGHFINPPQYFRRSPDERLLAVADSTRIQIWDRATASLVTELTGYHGPPYNVEFSPDGTTLGVSSWYSYGAVVNLWSLTSEQFASEEGIPCGGVLAFHPVEDLLLCGGVRIDADTAAPREVWRLTPSPMLEYRGDEEQYISHLHFSPDGNILTVTDYSTLSLLNFQTRTPLVSIEPSIVFSTAQFSRDGQRIYFFINGIGIYGHHLSSVLAADSSFDASFNPIFSATCIQPGQYPAIGLVSLSEQYAVVGCEANVYLFEVATGQLLHEWRFFREYAQSLAFSADGRLLAAGICRTHLGCRLHVFSVPNRISVYVSELFEEAIYDLAFSPDDSLLVAATGRIEDFFFAGMSVDNAVRMWAVPAGY